MKKILLTLTLLPLSIFGGVNQFCTKAPTATTVKFINNCSQPVSISMTAGMYGKDHGIPSCLQNLSTNGGHGTVYLSQPPKSNPWGYAFYKSTNGTRFELTLNATTNNRASWDVSANAGWDVGMTVLAPTNKLGPTLLVATSANAPGIYPPISKSNPCAVQPCASNAWVNNNIKPGFTVYLCNRSGDKNQGDTPGVCGCKQCLGISCKKGQPNCTTSGNNIYCKTICNQKPPCLGINWQNPPAQVRLCRVE